MQQVDENLIGKSSAESFDGVNYIMECPSQYLDSKSNLGPCENAQQDVDFKQQVGESPPQNEAEEQGNLLTKSDICVSINESHCVIEDGKQHWKCHLCPKIYTRKHNLVTHIMSHVGIRPYSCAECGKTFRQLTHVQTHMATHQNSKNFKCEYCGRGFGQLTHLKRHLLLHQDEKPYTCEVCSRGFAYPSELRKHLDKHREAAECHECGKEVLPHKMEQHMVTKHFLVNKKCKLNCSACNEVFSYPSSLQEHIESEHSDLLTHLCDKCPMKFLEESHLKAHLSTHRDSKTHSCLVCGRGFSQKGNMERHMLIHSQERQFECDICGKKFSQSQVLKMHKISHSSSKPFQCSICGKALARSHNLKAHIALHLNKKPYQCSVCSNSFTLKGNLYRHQKEKHGKVIREPEIQNISEQNATELISPDPEIEKSVASKNVPVSLLELQTNNGGYPMTDSDICVPEKLAKRRKGSPKRITNDSNLISSPTSPNTPFLNLQSSNTFIKIPNSPAEAGSSSLQPFPEEPSASNTPIELHPAHNLVNPSLSPIANTDFLLSSSLPPASEMSSPYFNPPPTSYHLPSNYQNQTMIPSFRPLVTTDLMPRTHFSNDYGNSMSAFISLPDNFGLTARGNDTVNAKLQFVHGEIDELVNKMDGYSSEKVNALHVAVNELAGLHMTPSAPSAEIPNGYIN